LSSEKEKMCQKRIDFLRKQLYKGLARWDKEFKKSQEKEENVT
jgi:hypothetical protein